MPTAITIPIHTSHMAACTTHPFIARGMFTVQVMCIAQGMHIAQATRTVQVISIGRITFIVHLRVLTQDTVHMVVIDLRSRVGTGPVEDIVLVAVGMDTSVK